MTSGSMTKYPVMSLEDIKALKVQNIAEKNAILFLWATVPLLPEAFEVMKAWGFKYKTSLFWRKIMSLGMGFWFRGQVEVLLMGMRGKVKAFRMQRPNFVQCKVGRHSEKPEIFRELIEMTDMRPRIELFARKRTKGWDVWGDEVEGDIEF